MELGDPITDPALIKILEGSAATVAPVDQATATALDQQTTPQPWGAIPGDRWIEVQDASLAINALGVAPRRVFLGVGRQAAINFRDAPQHSYLLRVIDPPHARELPLECEIIIGRGPFALENELALLQEHKINVVVSKNSGGVIGYTKIIAARQLGLEVIMISPPKCNSSLVAYDYDTAMKFLAA